MLRHIPAVGFTTFSADCDISRRRCDIFRRLWRFPAMRHFPALHCSKHTVLLGLAEIRTQMKGTICNNFFKIILYELIPLIVATLLQEITDSQITFPRTCKLSGHVGKFTKGLGCCIHFNIIRSIYMYTWRKMLKTVLTHIKTYCLEIMHEWSEHAPKYSIWLYM